MKIFLRLDKIKEEIAKMLKDLNVIEAIIGVESGCPLTLKNLKKGETVEQIGRAIKILHKFEIRTAHCFILGAPEESQKTILQTLNFAKELAKDKKNVSLTKVNVLVPFPGSRAWQMLLEKTDKKYRGKDLINWREVSKEWIKNFCRISLEDFGALMGRARKII